MIGGLPLRLAVCALVLVSAGCASGVSECRRNAKSQMRDVGKNLLSFNVVQTVIDIALLPVATTAGCATDVAMSPVYEGANKLRDITRKISAVRVGEDDARVVKNAGSGQKFKAAGSASPASPIATQPIEKRDACEYRTGCMAASSLLVTPSARSTDANRREHAQYSVVNNCGETVDCFICGTRGGMVKPTDTGACDDPSEPTLEAGETWVADGQTPNVDGMALTCLARDDSAHVNCTTWPK